MIRVMQFADVINRHDFIDVILEHADRKRFKLFACLRTMESNIADPEYSFDVTVCQLPGISRWWVPLTILRLAWLLRKHQIDVLHTHHFDQAFIGWIATRFSPKTKLVVGRHYSGSIYELSRGWKQKLLLWLEQRVNHAATFIIVPTVFIQRIILEQQSIAVDKIVVVPYAFIPDKYDVTTFANKEQVRKEFGVKEEIIFANFARLHPEKGHTFLLQAVQKIKSQIPLARFLIVGDGAHKHALQQEINERGLQDQVQLLGWSKNAMSIMNAVDVVVQPTLLEAFSQVMAEAMYLAKPLIITHVSGAEDVVEDGANGFIVPLRDPDALADRILCLYRDASLRNQMGQYGQNRIKVSYTVAEVIPKYEAVYCAAASVQGLHE